MKLETRTFLLMLAVTIVAAALAGWFGVQYGLRQPHHADLDAVLHAELGLSRDQDQRLESLEAGFATKHRQYSAEMQAANSELAVAISRDHSYGPGAQHAIEHFHRAMAALQEESVRHVLAMRAVLTPDQARKFDVIITKNLTGHPA